MDDLELLHLRRVTRVALGLAIAALVLGPVAGFAGARLSSVPGPVGPAGSVGPQGDKGEQGPPGRAATTLSGGLVLADAGCPPGSSGTALRVATWPLTFSGTVSPGSPFVDGVINSMTLDVCRVD